MDIKSSGLQAIQQGFAGLSEVAAKISAPASEDSPDGFDASDAVTVSLSKLQVKAGISLLKTSEELSDSVLSLLA